LEECVTVGFKAMRGNRKTTQGKIVKKGEGRGKKQTQKEKKR